ncbi:hypothetical protein ACFWY5_18080 [Nonomuraea sp. NPDC059007]|uniref:hypothetical protein n=1 Tax=Nonomuraea sp. NPDC059007 TaxID=3346692 RepID=UPI003673E9CA
MSSSDRDFPARCLAGAWGELGDFDRARAVAASIADPRERALASLARLAPAPLSARLLCLALAQDADHTKILHILADLAPDALRTARSWTPPLLLP